MFLKHTGMAKTFTSSSSRLFVFLITHINSSRPINVSKQNNFTRGLPCTFLQGGGGKNLKLRLRHWPCHACWQWYYDRRAVRSRWMHVWQWVVACLLAEQPAGQNDKSEALIVGTSHHAAKTSRVFSVCLCRRRWSSCCRRDESTGRCAVLISVWISTNMSLYTLRRHSLRRSHRHHQETTPTEQCSPRRPRNAETIPCQAAATLVANGAKDRVFADSDHVQSQDTP